MTPIGIKTGKGFDCRVSVTDALNGGVTVIAPADSNRVALSVCLAQIGIAAPEEAVRIGVIVGTTILPLTTLTLGSPKCYLSVDKIGSLVMGPIGANTDASNDTTISVSTIRQVQELP